jgi:hypothetical protein
MFFVVLAAWLVGVILSLMNGNRKLPITIFAIGAAATAYQFSAGMGYFYIALMAIISVIIWIANKVDMA